MPPAYTPPQRAAIQQYAQFAKVKDSVAAKALKAVNWDVNVALNDLNCSVYHPRGEQIVHNNYPQARRDMGLKVIKKTKAKPKTTMKSKSSSRAGASLKSFSKVYTNAPIGGNTRYYNKPSKGGTEKLAATINGIFDQYRDEPKNNPDTIGVDGTMGYMSAIGVTLEEPTSVAIHHVAGAESMGELERNKFVAGWTSRLEGSGSGGGGLESMRTAAKEMRAALARGEGADQEYFRAVYRHAFLLGRAPGQKSAQAETALELWRLMLGGGGGNQGGWAWHTANVDWISLWVAFIEAKGLKVVSRDLWNQTEAFARRTLEDESLAFWSEEASWPTVIDEFVAHIKDKGTAMDVE